VALVPCSPDLRTFAYKVENTRIQDPELRRQLELFTRDCWQQARAKFYAGHGSLPGDYPPDDLDWVGSQYFLDTDGYYGTGNINLSLRASEEIPGFPYNATRDTEYLPGFIPDWGRPACKDWWENATSGIKPRLLSLVDFEAVTQATIETGDIALANNALMRKVLEPEKVGLGRLAAGRFGSQFDDPNALTQGAANVGLAQENLFWRPKIYALRQVAPIGQSLILMGIYFFLPFILLYSGFSIETVFTLSVVIMGLQFLTPIWTLATWLDNHLIEALGISWFDWNPLEWSADKQNAKYVLNLAAMLMFVALPVLWFTAIGWAGLHLHKTLEAFNPMNQATQSAAATGIKTASKAAGKALK
jgi:TraG-like protein, N-terminal region